MPNASNKFYLTSWVTPLNSLSKVQLQWMSRLTANNWFPQSLTQASV